jgi:hypothetical protein
MDDTKLMLLLLLLLALANAAATGTSAAATDGSAMWALRPCGCGADKKATDMVR